MTATVLIVDDDPNTRLLVRTVLEHAGHSVIEASDGPCGLASAARADLILLDLSLASMSGPEFVRALRADPKAAGVAVALYTATPMNPALRDFMQIYGIEDVVPKPCEPRDLIAAVESALAARRRPRP